MKKKILIICKYTATFLLLFILMKIIDIPKVLNVLKDSLLICLVPILILRLLFYITRGYKVWYIVSKGFGKTISFFHVAKCYFFSCNLGMMTPSGIGDLSFSFFLKNKNVSPYVSFYSVVFDKLIMVIVTCLVSFFAIKYFRDTSYHSIVIIVLFAIMLTSSLLVFLLICNPEKIFSILRIKKYIDFPFTLENQLPIVIVNITMSIFQIVITAVQMYVALLMVGWGESDFSGIIALMGVSRLLMQIPITVGGLGVYELGLVVLFENMSIPGEITLSATIICRFITWLVAIMVSLWFVWNNHFQFRQKI